MKSIKIKQIVIASTLALGLSTVNASFAGTADTTITVSGTVVASCSVDPSISLDMGSNIQAGTIASGNADVGVTCTTSSASWLLKSGGGASPFTLGANNDYYAIAFSDPDGANVITTSLGVNGAGTSTAKVYVKVGRSTGPFDAAMLGPIQDTGTFTTSVPLVLAF
jgi:hypothetical protein